MDAGNGGEELSLQGGILGDSHEMFGDPGQLSPSDQTSLMEIEIEMGIDNPEAGRYMLFIARKL